METVIKFLALLIEKKNHRIKEVRNQHFSFEAIHVSALVRATTFH